jgi:1,4-alpha-glucan branching enzyme
LAKGELAIVLHAHLPYVRSEVPGSLEEDWFFQALMECYLPLLQTLEEAAASKEQRPRITIGLSPTLLTLLQDKDLKKRFPDWLTLRIALLNDAPQSQIEAATHLSETIKRQLNQWGKCCGDLIARFAELQNSKVVDLLTCAATHGYLPLLREKPEAVNGQLKTAVTEHHRLFGVNPLGIWLPECAYYEGLDNLMINAGLRYAILDGHGLLHASPRPRYGIYAPICSKSGVAFFGRDSEATLPVWSAKAGYPGNAIYREFHRDLGWDLPAETLNSIGLKEPRPLGLKLHKVTNQTAALHEKEAYEPKMADKRIKEDAKNYLQGRKAQLEKLNAQMDIKPLLVAPFDAELFGHWWFEGPSFLAELFLQANDEGVTFTRLRDVLTESPKLQLCEPCPSSWGKGGYHDYWLNETNAWIIPEWSKATNAMIESCNTKERTKVNIKLLEQAARELLLSQSSDWSFILRAGTTTDLAKERIHRHLSRFWKLIRVLNGEETITKEALKKLEADDRIFPSININNWSKFP